MITLRCIDQEGIVSELRQDIVATGFRERGCYYFFTALDGASLYIDEAPAEQVQVDGADGWRWQPGFYAGRVVAELISSARQCVAEYLIDVAPDDSKLGKDTFEDMLDDLYRFDPALLLGTEIAQASIGVLGEVTCPLLHYARLRRYGDALVSALREVAVIPLTQLKRERVLIPYHRVRRLDSASARRLQRRHETAAFLYERAEPAEGTIPLFDVMHSIDDLDNPANRALTATLLAVRRRCVQVADEFRAMAMREQEAATRTPLQPRLGRKLEFLGKLVEKLGATLRLEPYVSINRPEVTAAGLNAISAQPCYARAYRFAWCALRSGVGGDDRPESHWLSPTWEIYERWCFKHVVSSLRMRYQDLQWSMHYPSARSDHITLVGYGSGVRMEAWLQPRFLAGDIPSGDNKSSRFRSISGELHPDLLITVETGEERKMIVLDAKYRTTRSNVLDAMRSAHLYRDALRWDGVQPNCSLLLVPRGGGAPWLEDPAFQSVHHVGVCVVAPGTDAVELTHLLERLLPSSL